MTTIGEWIRTSAAAVSPVLVVLGWWWVNRQSNQREGRKELRQLVDRAIRTVSDAVDAAMKYHSAAQGVTVADSWKLLLAINQVKNHMLVLAKNGVDTGACAASFIRLKQAATGHDFMTTSYSPWTKEDRRWMVLIDSSSSLSHQLDMSFFQTFCIEAT